MSKDTLYAYVYNEVPRNLFNVQVQLYFTRFVVVLLLKQCSTSLVWRTLFTASKTNADPSFLQRLLGCYLKI